MSRLNENKVRFGDKERKPKKSRWKSIEKLNCDSSEFNDIDGVDFFYSVFHHDRKHKNKIKEIINNINSDNKNKDEKMMTGKHMVRFTPILYSFTKKMVYENTKEYRKFQKSHNYLNKKKFKNWLDSAHNNVNDVYGIGLVLLNLRRFWAVFFSSFRTFKNFESFEKEILGGTDKISYSYTKYVKVLTEHGVAKHTDTEAVTSTHHYNNIKTFTDYSIFSELWRLNKPIYCTYRTLFIECTKGLQESDKCPFNNWKDFNFKRIKTDSKVMNDYVGNLISQNDGQSIVGYINTGQDMLYKEIATMFEQNNPTDRARLLKTSKLNAESAYHIHGADGPSRHTHSTNPADTSSKQNLAERVRAATAINTHQNILYGKEGTDVSDPALKRYNDGVLGSTRHQMQERDEFLDRTKS